jgi:cell division protease FtsH
LLITVAYLFIKGVKYKNKLAAGGVLRTCCRPSHINNSIPVFNMSTVKKRRNAWFAKRKWLVAIGVLVTLVVVAFAVHARLDYERAQRISPLVRSFEQDPDAWLAHPTEWSDFLSRLKGSQVAAVGFNGHFALYTLKSGGKFSAVFSCLLSPDCGASLKDLGALTAKYNVKLVTVTIDTSTPTERILGGLGTLLSAAFPILFLGSIFASIWLMSAASRTERVKLVERPDARFDTVIGAGEAKQALKRVKSFMLDPKRYATVGAKPPRGVLMAGPPGTGKTLLARALAGECGANFISVDGSHFSSMYYGQGISKVKKLFAEARKQAPCVLFIDEIDGIGMRVSNSGSNGGEQEGNRIINRILVEMDGFDADESVLVIGATNHVDNIDPALRRSGRFDLSVTLSNPTAPEREQLFQLYLGKVKATPGWDIPAIARMASGVSPADIQNLVNQAASRAAEEGHLWVREEHMFAALEAHQLGGDVNSVKDVLSTETSHRIAVHEAGHALVAHLMGAGSVDRVSIEPRGPSLGVTFVNRANDEPLYGERELKARLAMMLAGREAELLILGNTSSGASDDLKRATEMATNMAGSLGFSPTFGLLSVAGLPKELLGPDVQRAVLDEARSFLAEAQQQAVNLLVKERERLERLVALLHEHQTVGGAALKEVLGELPSYEPEPELLLAA